MKCVSSAYAIDIYFILFVLVIYDMLVHVFLANIYAFFKPDYTECLICSFMVDGWYFSS